VNAHLKTTSNLSSEKGMPAEASAAIEALAEIFVNSKNHCGYRRSYSNASMASWSFARLKLMPRLRLHWRKCFTAEKPGVAVL
jgi:hypothetical protein